jgi:NAD(P)-dependent dehydrogenase (short-subunit alcohol dehydrogenase family)
MSVVPCACAIPYITGRDASALAAAAQELGEAEVIAIAGDVADPNHRRALVQAVESVGGLDALINNASTLGPTPLPTLLDYPVDRLEEVYRINTVAPLALLQAVRPFLNPGGRVINVTSDAAVEPYETWGGYGSSKAALEHVSAILAAENPGLKIYWVDPGDMRTDMQQAAFPGEDISDRPPPQESVPGFLKLLQGDLPSGRYQARAIGGAS